MRFAVAIVSPPSHFDISGGAFNEVAEALHHALLALGHDSVLTNRLDLDERRTIVLGGNLLVQYGLEPPKNPIFYNLEQLGDDLPSMTLPAFFDLFRRYPTWDYSQANIEWLAAMGLPRPTYVPIGYVPELTRIAPAPEDIDVLFYGAPNGRRYAVLRDLHDRGLRVKWLSGVYGASRDAWIARSKIVLNIHYWEAKIFEITRVSYLLANRRAVVSERGDDPTLERDLESGVAFADYDGLVDRCVELLGDERARRELAERGYQAFSARDQADILHRALSEASRVSPTRPLRGTTLASMCASKAKTDSADRSAPRPPTVHLQPFKHKFAPDRDLVAGQGRTQSRGCAVGLFPSRDLLPYWTISSTRASGVRGGSRWAAATRRSTGRCTGSRSRWRNSVSRGRMFRRPTSRRGSFDRPAQRRCMPSPFGVATSSTTSSVTRLPSAPPKSHFPKRTSLSPRYFAEVYAWRATDEQAICASWIGKHAEAFTLCRRLLARPDLPEPDRQRIAANRDFSVPAMIEAAAPYPEALVQSLAAGPGQAEVTVSLIAGPDRQTTEQTINSFLNCCLDVSRVGRFLVLDTGLSAPDRAKLRKRYGFLKFARRRSSDKPAAQLAQLRAQIDGRFWLHLGEGWRFFAPENYITRLTAVLDAEPQVFQVGINFADAVKLTGASAAEQAVRRAPDAGRYLLTEAMATGPAMFDTARLDRAIGVQNSDPDPPAQLADRPPAPGCAPPASTKCSASQVCTSRHNSPKPTRLGPWRQARVRALTSKETSASAGDPTPFSRPQGDHRRDLVLA